MLQDAQHESFYTVEDMFEILQEKGIPISSFIHALRLGIISVYCEDGDPAPPDQLPLTIADLEARNPEILQ